jgi:hypothetical protein
VRFDLPEATFSIALHRVAASHRELKHGAALGHPGTPLAIDQE